MRPRVVVVALAVTTILSLEGCGPAPLHLRSHDTQPRSIELQTGQELVLDLESNPTTGYSWMRLNPSPILPAIDDSKYTSDPSATPGQVGTGGLETWRFRAAQPGRATLHLVYTRPSEKGTPPAKEYRVDVLVK